MFPTRTKFSLTMRDLIGLERNVLICEPTGQDVVPLTIGFPVEFRSPNEFRKNSVIEAKIVYGGYITRGKWCYITRGKFLFRVGVS